VILPFLYVRIKNQKEVPTPLQEAVPVQSQKDILAGDKNIHLETTASAIDSSGQENLILFFDSSIFPLTNKSVIELKSDGSRSEFQLPGEYGNIVAATTMDDLKLILLLTDQKKIISFSPVTNIFKENNLTIPQESEIASIGTYLTYLYIVDKKNNQIYRYPRAEGGFGEKVNWLKDQVDLSAVSDMTIDENIYLAEGNALAKLFQGKLQDFNVEQSATPISFERVFTNSDTDKIYVLDGNNSRIVVFGKDGLIQQQYYNELFKNASHFTVDYVNNKVFVITVSGDVATLQL
jgi:hypothetical protein